ncbi:MAG: M23 family metallopeptidase [Spirochaetales bacterium]|nr:M23 family metallopeptidase [Leptospiraceae bacterium]MCP5481149.1 M23 family metallopeptidase [Spirochaetales bacterium]
MYHDGLDIGVPAGTPIIAPAAGRVVRAASNTYGNYVILEHRAGQRVYYSLYGHLKEPSQLRVGENVSPGMQIGRAGSTGQSTGPHLYFETWEGSLSAPCDSSPASDSICFPERPARPEHRPGRTNPLCAFVNEEISLECP